ncbi:methyltransferase domain-containing protein [Aquimarina sp. 2201CG14-23]|uniref:methyltransferase domain-containing protein n=1 Tax=Aquimarina mycalae TaxID=3040073 RepID=UPI00247811EE|nr:methyltransferase domain-containing protein [Aquimarina sp. 2201CG14-23]MDH7446453.1 methyltransferase domain-containing protein [Aquimarina sp. 2201CG14-23]
MLINLRHRSNEEELMDDPEVDEQALNIALQDISRANKLLGGNNVTIKTVFNLIQKEDVVKEWVIIDFGCGDGEILRQLINSSRKKGIKLKLIGIDNNEKCVIQARKLSISYPEIEFFHRDILTVTKQDFHCDIIICTLTLHHFDDEQIKNVLKKSISLVSKAVIINDIHRNKVSYYLFKLFSFFFIKGYIAKYDGLISIKRGFKKRELVDFAKELQISSYQLDWK